MFIRFRQRNDRLYVLLCETQRINGAVRQYQRANLGVVGINEQSRAVAFKERFNLWTALHEEVGRLGIPEDVAGKLMDALNARIPLPTQEQQGAGQLENAEGDLRFWNDEKKYNGRQIATYRELIAHAEQCIAEHQEADKKADENRAKAADEVTKLGNYRGL